MSRRSVPVLALMVLIAGCADRALAGDAARTSRQAQAYHLYALAQQSLMDRDYLQALRLMETAAERDASPDLLMDLARLRFSLNDLDRAEEIARQVIGQSPDSGSAHRLLGDIHLSRAREGDGTDANIARAIEEYRAALVSDPGDDQACRSLAEVLYHTGQLPEARDLLSAFSRVRSLDPDLSLLLGKVYVRTGQHDEAEAVLSQLIRRAPHSLEAVDTLAALYEHQKKYDEAIALYTPLLEGGAAGEYLHERIGALHLEAGRFEDAIRELEEGQSPRTNDARGLQALAQAYEGAGRLDDALDTYERLSRLEPGNLEARFHQARLLQREGKRDEAAAGYRAVIEAASGRGAISNRESAILSLCHAQIGLLLMDRRDYEGAAGAFARALDRASEPEPELFLLLGRAHLEGGHFDEAARVAREATRRDPDDLELQVFEAEVALAAGDAPGSLRAMRSVIAGHDGSSESYGRVAEALLRQKQFDSAQEVLREGIRRHPEDDGLIFSRGAALERLGRIADAERLMERAIALNPDNAMALNYLGYMLAERGVKLRESIAYVERALAIDPGNPAYLDSLGWAQFKLAMYGPAEQNLRDALNTEGDDPTIHEHLGDLLQATGRTEEAVTEWQKALDLGHEDPDQVRLKLDRARATVGDRP